MKLKLPLKLLDRYILQELSLPFLMGLLVFSVILLGSSVLPQVFRVAEQTHLSGIDTLKLFLFSMPGSIRVTFLASALLAALLCFNQLSSQSEITALRSGGISLYQLLRPVFIFGMMVSILGFTWNEYLVPMTEMKYSQLLQRYQKAPAKNEYQRLSLTIYDQGFLTQMWYAKKWKENQMLDLSLIEFEKGQFKKVSFATEATRLSDKKWRLKNVLGHVFYAKDQARRFDLKFVDQELAVQPEDADDSRLQPQKLSIWELQREIETEKKLGRKIHHLKFSWHERIAVPFTAIVFVLLGAPLGIRPQRTSSGVGIGMTLLIVFGYYSLSSVTRAMGNMEYLPPLLAAWLPNLLILLVGVRILQSQAKGFN